MRKKYTYIKEDILNKAKAGEYQPGKAIPSERDLAAAYQVNRMTIRKALEDLMYEGILIKKKGSGTFLTDNKTSKGAWPALAASDKTGTVKIISCKLGEERNYGYQALQIEEGTPYWRLRRVRFLDNTPYAYEDIYFNTEFFEQLSKDDYEVGLRQLIARYIGDGSVTVYEDVEALLCLHNTALLLKVESGSPILQIKSYFEQKGKIIMHCRSYHPGDNYKYQSSRMIL